MAAESRPVDRSRHAARTNGISPTLATRLAIALYLAVSFFYLVFGQANADEGWYLYASRLVLHGALPYRDFAFPQMPLLSYVYSISQALGPNILAGRLTSLLISVGTLGMSLAIARRYAGLRASAITALLLSVFTFGVYFNTVVKTYALVSFCLTATLFVLSSDLAEDLRYPLALVIALVAALTRLTAIVFVFSLLAYILWVGSRRARILAWSESVAAGFLVLIFMLPDWPVAQWNLVGIHLSHWQDASLLDQLWQIFVTRLPDIARDFGALLVLAAIALYFVFGDASQRKWRRDPRPLMVVAVGLGLFGAAHLFNGQWELEYLVPAMTAFIPILGIALGSLIAEGNHATRTFVYGALLGTAFLLPLGESNFHLDMTGGRLPLDEIRQAATYVAANSQPSDRVLALEALSVVYEANREPLPGATIAQFSLQAVDAAAAARLHVMNYDLFVLAINSKTARVIVLTDGDWDLLTTASPPNADAVRQALDRNYTQALVIDEFGQFSRPVRIYLRK